MTFYRPASFKKLLASLFLTLSLSFLLVGADIARASGLRPYQAVYVSKLKGFKVKIKRRLEITDTGVSVSVDAKRFMFSLHENSHMDYIDEGVLRPLSYVRNRKVFGKKQNKDLVFNWASQTVQDLLTPEIEPLEIEKPCYDKLGYQTQIRLDLLRNPDLQQMDYFISDSVRNRVYTIVRVGEEVLETPLGKLNTIKFRRESDVDDREIFVWAAPDWDYLLVRLDETKKPGGKVQRMVLKSASIAGEPVTGLNQL